MRELVYVSEAKLQQLVPDLPTGSGHLRDVEAEVKTPVGGLRIGKAAGRFGPGLAAAVAMLEGSSRAPVWFAEPAVRPGMWVHFEAPMSYGDLGASVVFLDMDEADATYPTGGGLRLLLHGSRHHVIGSLATGDHKLMFDAVGPSTWNIFSSMLARLHKAESEEVSPMAGQVENPSAARHLARMVHILDRLADRLHLRHTAAWMAGYARITAMLHADSCTIMAATPLYVEHVAPPGPVEH